MVIAFKKAVSPKPSNPGIRPYQTCYSAPTKSVIKKAMKQFMAFFIYQAC